MSSNYPPNVNFHVIGVDPEDEDLFDEDPMTVAKGYTVDGLIEQILDSEEREEWYGEPAM